MMVRRVLASGLLGLLAVPLVSAAPRPADTRTLRAVPAGPTRSARVFARADSADPAGATSDDASAAPPVATPPSPEVAARARAEFEADRSGKLDRSRYSDDLNAQLNDGAFSRRAAALRMLGEVKSFTQVRKISHGAATVYVFRIVCENPPLIEETIAWNEAQKVDYLQFGLVR